MYFGSLVNDDEFYNKANELNLMTGDPRKLMEVNEHQSTFNLFVGSGQVKRTTKTMGSYGMTTTQTVTAGGMSNMHPSMSVPFQAKDFGQHVCAALDRFTAVTGRPVQPL